MKIKQDVHLIDIWVLCVIKSKIFLVVMKLVKLKGH